LLVLLAAAAPRGPLAGGLMLMQDARIA
jgi:hypothetical protein